MDEQHIKDQVRDHYAQIARQGSCGCGDGCCTPGEAQVIPLVDYGDFRLEVLDGSDLGLGCGAPTRFTNLQPGEVVLDLGSGAGIDVFLAARQVGDQGMVIGVDMTPDMISRARENALRGGFQNVDFRLGEIENLPVEIGSVDVVISNCVLNLVPDKRRAFAEIYRVLKSGGRFVISDMVTYGHVPETIRQDMLLWAGCVAGASDKDEYLRLIEKAGFARIRVYQQDNYDAYRSEDYGIASLTVKAIKP